MNLTGDELQQLNRPDLTPDERALLRCRTASELTHKGQYEAAHEALGSLWQGVGQRPDVKGLAILTTAEVLLQCGVLSGWLGSVRQIPDAQEKAKDLLTEALRKFQSQGQKSKVAEVQYELGMCYFRLGAYDESRVVIKEALEGLEESDAELRAKALIRRTLVEVWTRRYHDALGILEEAREFFEQSSDALKGRWHGQRALVLRRLATAEHRTDYVDRAIIEFTAAAYHLEKAKHEQYCASTLNNLAMLLYKLGRYEEAHEHLDRAVRLLTKLQDSGFLAQVNETRSRVLLAERRYEEANRVISDAIQTLEKSGEPALLADALTIQGIAWARLGTYEKSIQILRRAINTAQDSGASSNAGLAALALIEEHGPTRLFESELHNVYRRADNLLKDTQDAEDISRLRACANIVIERLSDYKLSVRNFALPQAVLAYEARLIEEALRLEEGSVTRAAKRLGLSHQTLGEMLKARHKSLLPLRTALKQRLQSAILAPNKPARPAKARKPRTVTILHAEDDKAVADVVKDTLESNGWIVKTCADGVTALRQLASEAHYDLLLFDDELPAISGLELVRTARQLPHRRRTPIIIFSASDREAEAWKAGVDAFLRKPEDVSAITSMIARLLESKGKR